MSKRKCDSCIHSHVCEEHIHDVWNTFDNCHSYDAEQPRGEWHTTHNPNYSPFDSTSEVIYTCSRCDYSCGDRIAEIWNFCPNCGAPMNEKALEILRKREKEGE